MCNKILGILTEEGTSNWIEHLELSHRVKDSKLFNIYPFLLYGIPDFDFACFDEGEPTLMEYQADWVMNEKCFLTYCKNMLKNENRLAQHESTRLKHMNRMKVQIAPFWQFIKVNTPDVYDHKFYDF
jgi:hypothetical protein